MSEFQHHESLRRCARRELPYLNRTGYTHPCGLGFGGSIETLPVDMCRPDRGPSGGRGITTSSAVDFDRQRIECRVYGRILEVWGWGDDALVAQCQERDASGRREKDARGWARLLTTYEGTGSKDIRKGRGFFARAVRAVAGSVVHYRYACFIRMSTPCLGWLSIACARKTDRSYLPFPQIRPIPTTTVSKDRRRESWLISRRSDIRTGNASDIMNRADVKLNKRDLVHIYFSTTFSKLSATS